MLDSPLQPLLGLRSRPHCLLTNAHFGQFSSLPAPAQKHEGVAGHDHPDLNKGVRWSLHEPRRGFSLATSVRTACLPASFALSAPSFARKRTLSSVSRRSTRFRGIIIQAMKLVYNVQSRWLSGLPSQDDPILLETTGFANEPNCQPELCAIG